jgi:hypothetical protein
MDRITELTPAFYFAAVSEARRQILLISSVVEIPIIISSHVWGPQVTNFVGSG